MKYLFCFLIIIGCKSKKVQLEKNSELILKEGFFVEIPPATFEGNTSLKVTLNFHEFDKEKIRLEGFYFRGNYISMKKVFNEYSIEGIIQKKDVNANDMPFFIKPYEVVLVYVYESSNKLKYTKFRIKRKVSFDDVPR